MARNSTLCWRSFNRAASSLLRERRRNSMAGSRSRRGCGYSASRINLSPLPKPLCRALTSQSLSSKHCPNHRLTAEAVAQGIAECPGRKPAAPGVTATCENRSCETIHQTELSGSDQDQQFRILKRILPASEQIPGDGSFSEAWQAADGASFFGIGETADQSRFVQFDANRLRHGAVGEYGNTIHAGAGQGADFELQQHSHFIVGMKRGCRLYLHPEIDIFRGRIRSLPNADG